MEVPDLPAVRLENVHKGFREGDRVREVLAGVDLEVAPGERVALIGPSGSGKSTIFNLIGGMDRPDSGTVQVGGLRVDAMAERERSLFRRAQVGFVFQFFNLLPTLTVLENVLLPLELTGALNGEGRDQARALLREVGLVDRTEAYPDRLSGGERQRVAIARALVHRPPLILADEPTGTLDRATGDRVMELLDQAVSSRGTTLMLVTHSERLARRVDRVLELDEGRVRMLDPSGAQQDSERPRVP